MASWIPLIVLNMGADQASSNIRLKMFVASRIISFNLQRVEDGHQQGFIIFMDSPCVAHIIHRMVEKIFGSKALIPKMHALAWTCNRPCNMHSIAHHLKLVVTADLRHNFFPGAAPPNAFAEHTRHVLSFTLLRVEETRGRYAKESECKSVDQVRATASIIAGLANGDWRLPAVQHYCHLPGCCSGPDGGRSLEVCVDKFVAWFMEFLFERAGTQRPSTSRWYTFPEALAVQSLGFVCHRILPRTLSRGLEPEEDEDDAADAGDGEEVSAWLIYANRKMKQCVDFVEDPESAEAVCLATLLSMPLDKVSARLQHLDDVGSGLGELTMDRGLLEACQREYFCLMDGMFGSDRFGSDCQDKRLEALDHHFGSPDGLASRARGIILSLAANVWVRLELRFLEFPWKLIGSQFASRAGRLQIFQDFFDARPCCLDEWVGQWLRASLARPEDLEKPTYRMLIATLARSLKATNMHIEGLLNVIRQSSPQAKKKATVEKLHHLGLLSQLLAKHEAAGRGDACRNRLHHLIQQGVPVQVSRQHMKCVRSLKTRK